MLPCFSRNRELWRYSYFLSNRNCFFHRFADTGFKNKWTGLWSREKKYLEYYAVKAGEDWLSPESSRKIDYNFASSVHTHRTSSGRVRETLFIPDKGDSLVVMLSAPKPLKFRIEIAANIRKRTENKTYRPYTISSKGKSVTIGNELGKLTFLSLSGKMSSRKRPLYREHFPSGEEQNCMSPGEITLEGREVAFSLSCGKPLSGNPENSLKDKTKKYESLVGDVIKTDNRELEKAFLSSVLALELLTKDYQGRDCLYAGL